MKKGFFDLISLNEARISALIIGFFVTMGFAMYQYFTASTIDSNALNLLVTLIYVIGGVQATKQVSEKVADVQMAKNSVKENNKSEESEMI